MAGLVRLKIGSNAVFGASFSMIAQAIGGISARSILEAYRLPVAGGTFVTAHGCTTTQKEYCQGRYNRQTFAIHVELRMSLISNRKVNVTSLLPP